MAEHIALEFGRRFGGERVYVSRHQLLRSIRDEAVRRDFTGRNHTEVMRKHNISWSTLWRITSR